MKGPARFAGQPIQTEQGCNLLFGSGELETFLHELERELEWWVHDDCRAIEREFEREDVLVDDGQSAFLGDGGSVRIELDAHDFDIATVEHAPSDVPGPAPEILDDISVQSEVRENQICHPVRSFVEVIRMPLRPTVCCAQCP